jgi:hypothetical protein
MGKFDCLLRELIGYEMKSTSGKEIYDEIEHKKIKEREETNQ